MRLVDRPSFLQAIDFRDRVAVVTGGGSGIGRACVAALRAMQADVVAADLSFSASEDSPEDAPGSLREVVCDVTSERAVERLFAEVTMTFGRVDVLINSAGVLEAIKRTVDQDLANWEHVMSVNIKGAFLTCREAGRAMVKRRSGAIVNIGSAVGQLGIPGSNAYGPSKAALAQMTRNLACEWAPRGVRVNCVAPGYVRAPMALALFNKSQAVQEAALKRVPLGRLAEPMEIANVVLFLCSPLASYVTGTLVPVDGGWSAFGGPSR